MRFRLRYSWSGRLRPLVGLGSILTTSYGNHGQLPGWNPRDWTHVWCDAGHDGWLGPRDRPFLGDQDYCDDHPDYRLRACLRCSTERHRPPLG